METLVRIITPISIKFQRCGHQVWAPGVGTGDTLGTKVWAPGEGTGNTLGTRCGHQVWALVTLCTPGVDFLSLC